MSRGVKSMPLEWLLDTWCAKLAEVVQSMTDQQPDVTADPEWLDSADNAEPLFCQQFPLSIGSETSIWVAVPEATWLGIGESALRAVGVEQVEAADARNTYLEIINQATSAAVQALGQRLGVELNVLPARTAAELTPGLRLVKIHSTLAGAAPAVLYWAANAALIRALEPGPDGAAAGPARSGAGMAALPEAGACAPVTLSSKTLDLLMEVELPVSVSFGRARLPLCDVLKLTSGSIIELNRAVAEPVELIINGAVIARGEVVVIEGNYGLRIDQIVSRQERLRTVN